MELLFDDQAVDRKAGVRRALSQPKKMPEPILKSEMSWETGGISAHMAVLFDEGESKFKMWYRARIDVVERVAGDAGRESSERAARGERVFLCYAESSDGVNWYRPSLDLFEYEGKRENNILREVDFADSVFFNIIKDEDDPEPSRRYKAQGFVHDATRSVLSGVDLPETGVCVGYSADGLRWPDHPLLVMSTHDLTDADCILPHRDPATGKWVGYFRPRTHPKRRFIGYSESDDFERWTYPRMLITPDDGDAEWIEFYGLAATSVGDIRIGALWVYHNNPAHSPMTNELVLSRDGQNYVRALPTQQWLPLGPDGSLDSRRLWPVALIEQGEELLIYYNAGNREHGSDRGMEMQHGQLPDGDVALSSVGLARIPLGHYCGLHAEMDGMVESKWLCNYGQGAVEALAHVNDGGSIQAEVLDQYGVVVPGYDRVGSHAEQIGEGRYRFTWGGQDAGGQILDADSRVKHVVKLRFYLYKATLFGFQVGQPGAMPESE